MTFSTHVRRRSRLSMFAAAGCLVACLPRSVSLAQPVIYGNATWLWEVSADSGVTWTQGLVEVPQSQASIEVRARCLFQQDAPTWFYGTTFFDGVVSGVGPADSVRNIRFGNTLFNIFIPSISVQRFGDLLKIDRNSDASPPGLGSLWLSPSQGNSFQTPIPDYSSTFEMFEYQLVLDGTVGEREISGAFRQFHAVGIPPGQFTIVNDRAAETIGYYQALTERRSFVRVVPAPGVLVLGAGAWTLVRRRRHPA